MKYLKKLEDKFEIRYTLEIGNDKLSGTESHMVLLKFLKKPDDNFLKEFFTKDKYAQEVYTLEGDFDLFIYARAGNPVSYIRWETYIASELSEYRPILRPSEFAVSHMGFWPLNDSFVDEISNLDLDVKDKQLLLLLNKNSRISIKEMSKAMQMDKGTVRYRLLKLKKTGIIKRFTIAIQKPPQKYIILHFSNYRFNENIHKRMLDIRKMYMTIDDGEMPILGTYQIVAPISGSYRSFAMSLFFTEKEVINAIDNHKAIFKKDNIDISYAKIKTVVKGLIPVRNLDIKTNYMPIVWNRNTDN